MGELTRGSTREFQVWVTAQGYATIVASSKREAVEKARRSDFARTPRPEWVAQTSSVKVRNG